MDLSGVLGARGGHGGCWLRGPPCDGHAQPLSSECGKYKTVKAIFWPWLLNKSPLNKSPLNLSSCSLFARKRLAASKEDLSGVLGARRGHGGLDLGPA